MYEEKVKSTIDQADELLDMAKEAMCKPEEDVVPYMVCSNAYKSVRKYLTGFLMNHGVEIHTSMSIETLINLCRDVDKRFKDLNLEPLYHLNDPEDVWMNMDTVNDYLDLATKTREMVVA